MCVLGCIASIEKLTQILRCFIAAARSNPLFQMMTVVGFDHRILRLLACCWKNVCLLCWSRRVHWLYVCYIVDEQPSRQVLDQAWYLQHHSLGLVTLWPSQRKNNPERNQQLGWCHVQLGVRPCQNGRKVNFSMIEWYKGQRWQLRKVEHWKLCYGIKVRATPQAMH